MKTLEEINEQMDALRAQTVSIVLSVEEADALTSLLDGKKEFQPLSFRIKSQREFTDPMSLQGSYAPLVGPHGLQDQIKVKPVG